MLPCGAHVNKHNAMKAAVKPDSGITYVGLWKSSNKYFLTNTDFNNSETCRDYILRYCKNKFACYINIPFAQFLDAICGHEHLKFFINFT